MHAVARGAPKSPAFTADREVPQDSARAGPGQAISSRTSLRRDFSITSARLAGIEGEPLLRGMEEVGIVAECRWCMVPARPPILHKALNRILRPRHVSPLLPLR